MPACLLVPGDPEHAKHHTHRHRLCDLADPLHLSALDGALHDVVGERLDGRLQHHQPRSGERSCRDLSKSRVLGRVDEQDAGRVGGVVTEPLPPQSRACAIDALGSSPDRFAQACSAIHCCFVYVFMELRVSSSVSHQWFCAGDAPLPSSGSRWPRFPAFSGTIKALRLPALACPSAYCFRHPAPRVPAGVRVRLWGAPVAVQARRRTGVWIFTLAIPFPASLPTGKSRISQVPWRSIP